MSDTIRLTGVTVNAPDAIVLARFYAVVTGGVAKGNSRWATFCLSTWDGAQIDGETDGP